VAQYVRAHVDHATHRGCGIGVGARHGAQYLYRVCAFDSARDRGGVEQIGNGDFAADFLQHRTLLGATDYRAHVTARPAQCRRAHSTYIACCSKDHKHIRLLADSVCRHLREAGGEKRAGADRGAQIRMIVFFCGDAAC
jgi:hypothetical protein